MVGFVLGVGIYFDPGEPYPGFVLAATTLRNAMTGLLLTGLADKMATVWRALAIGLVVGGGMGGAVFLAQGGWATWDARFVIPYGMVEGAVIAVVIRWWARRSP